MNNNIKLCPIHNYPLHLTNNDLELCDKCIEMLIEDEKIINMRIQNDKKKISNINTNNSK